MIEVNEQDIDKISAVFYAISKGRKPEPIELADGCPDNEIRQAVGFINQFIAEYNEITGFVYQLGRGEINVDPPRGKMIIGQSLKELHASLKNLTWTTQQIAKGDFTQKISFMGEFSEAFNSMTCQLEASYREQQELTDDLHEKISEMDRARKAMLNILEDLDEARQKADAAAKAKADFLANMSHEIRTPMNAIIGMSHLALQTQLDPRQKNYIGKVSRSAENLLGIINDILDFSKVEAGKLSMEKIDFRLEDVMDDLANMVGMKAEERGLELLFAATPEVPTALIGDPLRLGQVLVNLGNNAVKFTEKGEIVVGVEPVTTSDDGVELHFWVKDSGIGMTPEQCGKMFQSFSQADASTTRKYGGTGLGLAISKNLVELMNGRIWVDSEAGKGSVFHFHAQFGLQQQVQPRQLFHSGEITGLRALIVDDNAAAREILSAMATAFGLAVDVARNGQQALTLIADAQRLARPYDLLLMDWQMPTMDGIECARRLQADVSLAKSPAVILITAYGRDDARGEAEQRSVHIDSVLTKPVTPSSLLDAVGIALGKGALIETRLHAKNDDTGQAMRQLSGSRVLLVEDNEMNQELASELLANAGMSVVLANDGQQALDILAADTAFDGILMDCQMPVMDGYTATRAIRQNPALAAMPIVAMTANAMAGDKEKVIAAGMNDHIAKPLNVGQMFATLARWIAPKAKAADASETTPAPSPDAGETLPELAGIDQASGLATTMGNLALYRRLLVKFRDGQANFAELFAAARHDPDPVAASRCAHTLKGTAGNIGASGVQAAAGELERACIGKAATDLIDQLLARTIAELAPVIASLADLGRREKTATTLAASPSALDLALIVPLLDRLAAQLADLDSEASDTVAQLLDMTQGTTLFGSLRKVAAAIEDYEFEIAEAALAELSIPT